MAAVVVKKEEKINTVFESMININDLEEFKTKFKNMYPKEWAHIQAVYLKEERADIKHKGHPMPHPEKYLENMYKNAISKNSRKSKDEL